MFSVWRNLHLSRAITAAAADFFALQPRQTLDLCSGRRGLCINPSRQCSGKRYNVPPSAEFVARVSGIPTMAKLPYQDTAEGLDAAFVGVPIDTGTSNRPGARFGPRQIRVESAMLRAYNSGTRAAPYESLVVADIGDVNVNVYDLKDTCKRIREAYRKILATGCIPLTMGGDHTIAYPILQAVAEKHGPVGLIHVDAHADTSDVVLGEKIGHGTPFRRCVEEGLLDCKRVVQIGLRGSGYSADSYEWSRAQGFRVVQVEECWFKSLAPLMDEVRNQMGKGPVYLSFDIDALDPGFAPGTGTPEIAGLTPIQGVEIIRGCRGLNLVGCDLVEVSPPYDTTGNTALTGANLLFEIDVVLGEKIGHGTPFRRCVEEGLLDCKRVVQIGLRGSGYSADSYEWSRAQGFPVVQVEECWYKSLAPLMDEFRNQMGKGPVYLSFDIDTLDPGFAPGTCTPEIAGLTPIQGVEIIRGCRGLNLVGCDLVEVSPPYDTTGNTALTGANLLFEMLCVLPKIKYY